MLRFVSTRLLALLICLIVSFPALCQNWSPLGSGVNGAIVYGMTVYKNRLIASGMFDAADGIQVRNIAAWNGSSWDSLGPLQMSTGMISALKVYNGELYASGAFDYMSSGTSQSNIMRWNDTSWNRVGGTSALDNGLYNQSSMFAATVIALEEYNGDLYAGGYFNRTAGNVEVRNIARWNGSNWVPMPGLAGSHVKTMAVYNGELYVGGAFTTAGPDSAPIAVSNIARWNGTNWASVGTGVTDNPVFSLAVHNGALYVGGCFKNIGGIAANHIAKWDGSSWSALGLGMDSVVRTLSVLNNELYASGEFSIAGGNPASKVAKWDGASWSTVGTGVNSRVWTSMVYDGALYIGGSFTTAGGGTVNRIARLAAPNSVTGAPAEVPVALFPNPNNGIFTVQGTLSGETEPVTLEITDITSRISLQQRIVPVAGSFSSMVSLRDVPKGVYMLRITGKKTSSALPFVVQ